MHITSYFYFMFLYVHLYRSGYLIGMLLLLYERCYILILHIFYIVLYVMNYFICILHVTLPVCFMLLDIHIICYFVMCIGITYNLFIAVVLYTMLTCSIVRFDYYNYIIVYFFLIIIVLLSFILDVICFINKGYSLYIYVRYFQMLLTCVCALARWLCVCLYYVYLRNDIEIKTNVPVKNSNEMPKM